VKAIALLGVAALVMLGCSESGRTFRLPTTPTTATPQTPTAPLPPAARPVPPVAADFTRLEVGQTIDRIIGDAPPECLQEPGWPCQYFRLTATESGALTITLRYVPDTQPPGRGGPQGVDVTLEAPNSVVWAQEFSPNTTRLTAQVTSGQEYQIVLWYTFPRLAFALTTTMR